MVIYSWNLNPQLIEQALAGGASGYLSKVLTGPAIVAALERIMAGEVVVLAGDNETSVGGAGDWPGREAGLSPREAEVIALITQGLSNQQIAERVYLSINSDEDLHPVGLPQDGRHQSHPSGYLGHRQRLQARLAAHARPRPPGAPCGVRTSAFVVTFPDESGSFVTAVPNEAAVAPIGVTRRVTRAA